MNEGESLRNTVNPLAPVKINHVRYCSVLNVWMRVSNQNPTISISRLNVQQSVESMDMNASNNNTFDFLMHFENKSQSATVKMIKRGQTSI